MPRESPPTSGRQPGHWEAFLPRAQCFVLDQKGTRGVTMGRCHISCWTALRPLEFAKHGQPSGQPTPPGAHSGWVEATNHLPLFYSIVLVICKWERAPTRIHTLFLPSSICIFFTKLSSPINIWITFGQDKIFPCQLSTRTLFGSWDHNSQIN